MTPALPCRRLAGIQFCLLYNLIGAIVSWALGTFSFTDGKGHPLMRRAKEGFLCTAGRFSTPGRFRAQKTCLSWSPTLAGIGNFFLALIYLVLAVPGSYFLWYKPLYNGMR